MCISVITLSACLTTVTIPYVKGTSETIARILQPYYIRVAHKLITTLQLLTKVKDKDEPNRRQDGITRSNATTARQLILMRPAEI